MKKLKEKALKKLKTETYVNEEIAATTNEEVEAEVEIEVETDNAVKVEEVKADVKTEAKETKIEPQAEIEAEVEIEVDADPEVKEEDTLTKKEENIVIEALEKDEKLNKENSNEDTQKEQAKSLLQSFKEYISSGKFDKKCTSAAKEHNLDKEVVKSSFIKNVLGTIGRTLHLAVNITGNVIVSAVHFINGVIESIVSFTSETLCKLVNLLTLNCAVA